MFDSPDFGFVEDAEIFLGGRVGSFGSGTEGLDLLISIRPAQDFADEPGKITDGHMAGVAVIADPVPTGFGVRDDVGVIGMQTLSSAGEGRSFRWMIETVGMTEKPTRSVGPSFLIMPSFFKGFWGDVF